MCETVWTMKLWNCLDHETVWIVCYVKNLHILFMCEWNDEIWIIIVGLGWIDLNSLNILNRLNRFSSRLNRFYLWTGWTYFFMKFLWNLNTFCCCFLSRLNRFCYCFLNRFCLNKLNIIFYEVSVKFVAVFLTDSTDFTEVFWTNWTNFV